MEIPEGRDRISSSRYRVRVYVAVLEQRVKRPSGVLSVAGTDITTSSGNEPAVRLTIATATDSPGHKLSR